MGRTVYYLLCLSTLTACAGNDLLVQRQNSMESRLDQMMQAQNSTTSSIVELSGQVKELQDQFKKKSAADLSVEPEQAALQSRLEAITIRIGRLEADKPDSRPGRIELVNSGADAQGLDNKIQSAYMNAFGLFSSNNYQAAAEAFEYFIEAYPESEHAANARYWLGECYFASGLFKKSIEVFGKIINQKYPGKKTPDAYLKTGLAWYGINEQVEGDKVLRLLLEKFPGTEAAGKANEILARQRGKQNVQN